jgi:hypothetical protein
MPNPGTKLLGRIGRLPAARLLVVAELLVLAKDHLGNLKGHERRRFLELTLRARGRPRNLNASEWRELRALIAKVDPRLFVGEVAEKLSPVPLPDRVKRGKR